MATAVRDQGIYTAAAPLLVGDPASLLGTIQQKTHGAILTGFDFPLGLPKAYAEQLHIESFPSFLRQLGQGTWPDFAKVCRDSSEISLTRPFYPYNFTPKGSRKRAHLVEALNLETFDQLLRACERAQPDVAAAGALFWTLGAQAPGRAALHGWTEVIVPALAHASVKLWPFDGPLSELLQADSLILAETYPTQYHGSVLGARFAGKTSPDKRRLLAAQIFAWSKSSEVQLNAELVQTIENGFPQGDDAFDAVLGLLGMIHVLLHPQELHEPTNPTIRNIEGWIFGQPAR